MCVLQCVRACQRVCVNVRLGVYVCVRESLLEGKREPVSESVGVYAWSALSLTVETGKGRNR